jgi:hypothetical protein
MRNRSTVALIALSLAVASCGSDKPEATPKSIQVAGKEPDDKPVETFLTITEVGTAGTDGGIRFRVRSLGEVRRIPPLVNDRGSRLVRARVSYMNRTKLPLDLLCTGKGFELLDSEDNHVGPLDGTRDLVGNEKVCGPQVLPGGTASGVLAFRIPDTVKVHGLEVFNRADERDPKGERTRLRFVNP